MSKHSEPKDLIPTLQRSARETLAPVQREINRILEDIGDGWDTFSSLRMTPAVDYVETKDGAEITLELPGLTRDQVEIAVEDNRLTISGEKSASRKVGDPGYRIMERNYGAFNRSVVLPRSVDGEQATATMKDGVLKITAPKRAGVESRKIAIKQA